MAKLSKSGRCRGMTRAKLGQRRRASRFDPLVSAAFSRRLRFESLESRRLLSVVPNGPNWLSEGPQSESGYVPAYVGAINQIAVDPHNPVHLLAATVNGGIWQTPDFAAPGGPTWTTTTDYLPSLSIASIAFSPVNSSVIYAGTGQFSSEYEGDTAVGIYKSIDGGLTWQVLNPIDPQHPGGVFTGLRIHRIIPTSLDGGRTVFAVTPDGGSSRGGIYRSDDGGASWNPLSGLSGLPAWGVSDLVEDPNNGNQFFAAISNSLGGSQAGIYMIDFGAANPTWQPVKNNMSSGDLNVSTQIDLSISAASPNPIWVSMIGPSIGVNNSPYQAIYRGVISGTSVTWQKVGPMPPDIRPDGSFFHVAMVADPYDSTLVYLAASSGPVVRGSSVTTNNWVALGTDIEPTGNPNLAPLIDDGSVTSPHRDYRNLVFADGYLLVADDGGVYQGVNPESLLISGSNPPAWVSATTGQPAGQPAWTSLNGNIRDTEGSTYAGNVRVSYDSQFRVIFGAAQDNGIPTQNAPGSAVGWVDQSPGDGGETGVDPYSRASLNQSVRYYYGVTRRIFVSAETPLPASAGGQDASILPFLGLPGLTNSKPNDLFNFSVVDAVPPGGIVAAGNANGATPGVLYESSSVGRDMNETPEQVNNQTVYFLNNANDWSQIATPSDFYQASAIAYGGNDVGGTTHADILYVASARNPNINGSRPTMYVRAPGGTLTKTADLPAGANQITSIAIDPKDWRIAVVSDGTHVYLTTTAGGQWSDVTGNLTDTGLSNCLAIVHGASDDAIIFAGNQSVMRSSCPLYAQGIAA
jgi:Planctomycete extracellular